MRSLSVFADFAFMIRPYLLGRRFTRARGLAAAAHPDIGCAESGRVGGKIIGLVLRLAFGRDPLVVVLDLALHLAPASQPRSGATSSAASDAAAIPRSQVSMEILVRRARMSSRCRAPSCDAA